jgi:CubicO group peptidase (beta-lactamase class C family)
LNFPPGTASRYSNTDYIVAGLLVEHLTGRPWATAVHDRIIRPLRLRDTTLPGTAPPSPAGAPYGLGLSTTVLACGVRVWGHTVTSPATTPCWPVPETAASACNRP